MKNLILIWGWVKEDRSYNRFVDTAPREYSVHPVSIEEVAPSGGVDEFVMGLEKYIQSKELNKTTLVAHSLGAAFVLKFVQKHPGSVEKIILSDIVGLDKNIAAPKLLWRALRSHIQEKGKVEKEHVGTVIKLFKKPKLLSKLIRHVMTINVSFELENVKVPKRVLWGEKDLVTPVPSQDLGKNMIILKEMDHNWILHSPNLFWENTKDFL